MCSCVLKVCMSGHNVCELPTLAMKGSGYRWFWTTCACRVWNLCLLLEQSILLTTEPYLQPNGFAWINILVLFFVLCLCVSGYNLCRWMIYASRVEEDIVSFGARISDSCKIPGMVAANWTSSFPKIMCALNWWVSNKSFKHSKIKSKSVFFQYKAIE